MTSPPQRKPGLCKFTSSIDGLNTPARRGTRVAARAFGAPAAWLCRGARTSPRGHPKTLSRVVEDDAEGVAAPQVDAAHAVTDFDAVGAALALHRALVDREHEGIALL